MSRMYRTDFDEEGKERLRQLRLWHWRAALSARDRARPMLPWGKRNAFWDDLANKHIRFVQTLNDFFEVGETAELDDQKSKP